MDAPSTNPATSIRPTPLLPEIAFGNVRFSYSINGRITSSPLGAFSLTAGEKDDLNGQKSNAE